MVTYLKKIKKVILLLTLFLLLITISINVYVKHSTKNKIFSDAYGLPICNTAIIFGAGIKDNSPSYILQQRLDKGIELYQHKSVSKIILSGDDGGDETDEISVMKRYCIEKGIGSEDIITDTKGYDTYSTIYR